MNRFCEIAILGGGISGLSLAYYLKKFHPQVKITLVEQKKRCGGVIATKQTPFFFEEGPHTLKAGKSHDLLRLIVDLGLKDQLIVANRQSAGRYIYHQKKFYRIPNTFSGVLFSPLFRSYVLRLITEGLIAPNPTEETIYNFFSRRFGENFAKVVSDAMVTGIFAGDIRKLSLNACFPNMKMMEIHYGSLTKAMFTQSKVSNDPVIKTLKNSDLISLEGGMGQLISKLVETIPVRRKLGEKALNVQEMPQSIGLQTDRQCYRFDHIFSALPVAEMSRITQVHLNVPSVDLVVINVGYRQKILHPKGFGYVIPSCENEDILGVVFDSYIFPQHNSQHDETRLTVMMGGFRQPAILEQSDEVCQERSLRCLEKHLKITAKPDYMNLSRYSNAIPQFELGYQQQLLGFKQKLKNDWPHLCCVGNYLSGVSVSDCVKEAFQAARNFYPK